MYQITGRKFENPMPDTNMSNEEFASLFMGNIKKIRDNLQHSPVFYPEKHNLPVRAFCTFKPATDEEVKKAIINLATKTRELDVLRTKLFNGVLDSFLPTVTSF